MASSVTLSFQATAGMTMVMAKLLNLGKRPTDHLKEMTKILDKYIESNDDDVTNLSVEAAQGKALREIKGNIDDI